MYIYSSLMAIAGLINLGIAIYAWKRRPQTGMAAFSVAFFFFSVWPLDQAVDILSGNLALKILLMKLRLDAPVFGALALIVMAAQLTDSRYWLKRRVVGVLAVLPVLAMILNWASPNALFRHGFYVATNGPFPILRWVNGPLFIINLFIIYLLYLIPFYIFWRSRRESSFLALRQIYGILVALLLPLIVNAFFHFGLSPIPNFNLTPITQSVTGLIVVWAIVRRRAYETSPFPRGQIISLMKDGVVVLDASGNVTDINPAARQILEIERPARPGKSAKEYFAEWPLAVHNLLDLEEGQTEIYLEKSASGYFDLSMAPLRDKLGRFKSRLLILRDITERRRADAATQNALDRFYLILSKMTFGILLVTDQGRVELANQIFCDIFNLRESSADLKGLSSAEILEMIRPAYLHPEEALARIREIVAQGQAVSDEVVPMRSERIFQRDFIPIPLGVNKLGRLWIHKDITERTRAEEMLRESQEQLAAVFNGVSETMMLFDTDGNIIAANQLAVERLNQGVPDFVGKNLFDIVPEQFRETRREQISEVVRTKKPIKFPDHLDNTDLEITFYPVFDSHGNVARLISFALDVTDRKRTEEAQRLHNEQLAEADRYKDQFLAMLARELRNPLAPIFSALELIRRQHPDPDAKTAKYVDVIGRQVTHLTRIVDDLLDTSRISRGRINLRKERVSLSNAVNQAVEMNRTLIETHKQELILNLPSEPMALEADPTRLVQMLSNLINNASKYTSDAGHIFLTVREEAGQAVIEVTDTGVGITAIDLPHIFDLFYQAEKGLHRPKGGLGLGLTLVRQLAEMHGGTIDAHSEGSGRGSVFILRLPLSQAQPSASSQAQPDTACTEGAVSKLKVLVVEDNTDTAESLSEILECWGHQAWIAHDGLSAIAKALETLPDVILLDIGLPGIDGYEVAQRLRGESRLDNTVLVALTGYGQREDRRRAEEAGFNLHFTKPVDLDALEKFLQDAAEGKS